MCVCVCVCVRVCLCVCDIRWVLVYGTKPEYTQPHGDLCHGGT